MEIKPTVLIMQIMEITLIIQLHCDSLGNYIQTRSITNIEIYTLKILYSTQKSTNPLHTHKHIIIDRALQRLHNKSLDNNTKRMKITLETQCNLANRQTYFLKCTFCIDNMQRILID